MSLETNGSLLDGQQTDAGLLGGEVGNGGNDTNVVTDPKPGEAAKPWLEQVSAEYRGNELLGGVENVNDLTGKYIETAGKLEHAIFKPGEDATADELKDYRTKMGIPEAPEGYEIKRPENLPEGLPYDEALEASAKEVFHKAGMSGEAAQSVMDFYNNMVIEAYTQMETDAEQARVDTKAALEKDWGEEMKPNVQLAERVMEKFGSEDFKLRLEESGLIYDPAIYRTFVAIGKTMSEDSLMKSAEAGVSTGMERTRDGTPMLKFKDMPSGG